VVPRARRSVERAQPAHRRRGCIRGLNPPVSSSERAM
jgi:hypothetical protein